MRPRRVASRSLVVVLASVTSMASAAAPAPVANALRLFLDGEVPAEELRITYTDLHPLHGGLELSIDGSGEVRQRVVRQGAGPTADLGPEEVRQLVQLLLDLEAWRQETPERTAVPDESRSRLTIEVSGVTSQIWEWYNEMPENRRLIRIRDTMRELSSPPPSSDEP